MPELPDDVKLLMIEFLEKRESNKEERVHKRTLRTAAVGGLFAASLLTAIGGVVYFFIKSTAETTAHRIVQDKINTDLGEFIKDQQKIAANAILEARRLADAATELTKTARAQADSAFNQADAARRQAETSKALVDEATQRAEEAALRAGDATAQLERIETTLGRSNELLDAVRQFANSQDRILDAALDNEGLQNAIAERVSQIPRGMIAFFVGGQCPIPGFATIVWPAGM